MSEYTLFRDRFDAGKQLAKKLLKFADQQPVVLALPRGGVLVGAEVAKALQAPLDVIISRKIGAPGEPELGIGAIAEGDAQVLDKRLIQLLHIPIEQIEQAIAQEKKELERQVQVYRDGQSLHSLQDRVAILVDDGLATGGTARATIEAVRKLKPKQVIFAVPTCNGDTAHDLKSVVDELFCLLEPIDFIAVGAWYEDFVQKSDQEVLKLLAEAKRWVR